MGNEQKTSKITPKVIEEIKNTPQNLNDNDYKMNSNDEIIFKYKYYKDTYNILNTSIEKVNNLPKLENSNNYMLYSSN